MGRKRKGEPSVLRVGGDSDGRKKEKLDYVDYHVPSTKTAP